MTDRAVEQLYVMEEPWFTSFFSRVKVVVKRHHLRDSAITILIAPAREGEYSDPGLEEIFIIIEKSDNGLPLRQIRVLGPFTEPFFTGLVKKEDCLHCRIEFNDPRRGGRRDEDDIRIFHDFLETCLDTDDLTDPETVRILSQFSEEQKLVRSFPGFLEIEEYLFDRVSDDPRNLKYSLFDGPSITGDHPYINQTLVDEIRSRKGACARLFSLRGLPGSACTLLAAMYTGGGEHLIFPDHPEMTDCRVERVEFQGTDEIHLRIGYTGAPEEPGAEAEKSGKLRFILRPDGVEQIKGV